MAHHSGPALAGVLVCALIAPGLAAVTARNIDGSENNVANSSWGAAGQPLLRQAAGVLPGTAGADYLDGFGAAIIASPARANPRVISNAIAAQGSASFVNDRGMSNYMWQWGQFLDHDIDLTGTGAANGTADISVIQPGDPLAPTIPFERSNFTGGSGVGDPRQQINEITAYIDASNVYGSTAARAAMLRSSGGSGAKLSIRFLPDGEFLPLDGSGGVLAGDVRAAEQVGLTAMHTLFVREHNRLVDGLQAINPALSDEQLYQTARKVVGAQMQSITYNEFLPKLLGANAPRAEDAFYDAGVNAQINNEFSTAFYRVGHSMLSPTLPLVNNKGQLVGQLALRDAFFNAAFLESGNNLELVLKGLASGPTQEIDTMIVDDVRNFLFGPPGAGGLDLASLNIQRGRDQGLPDYNTLRTAYGLAPVDSFDDISSDLAVQAALLTLYGNVDNIDAWVGGLAEDHLSGASVGELMAAALVDQFTRLRDGDRFFYVDDPDFADADIRALLKEMYGTSDIGEIRLGDIIRGNTRISNLQANVFAVPEPGSVMLWLLLGAGMLCGGLRCSR